MAVPPVAPAADPILPSDSWLSVSDFGAVGDGLTDDSAALQAAIDAAGTESWLRFPREGTYAIASGLTIPTGARIDLEGSTILRQAGSTWTGVQHMLTALNASDIVIRNGKIDGNKDVDSLVAATSSIGGVLLNTCTDVVLRDLEITRTVINEPSTGLDGGAGIMLYDCSRVDLIGIHGHTNDRTAVLFWISDLCRIMDSRLHDNLGSGVSSFTSPECVYRNLIAYTNGYSNVSVNGLRCIVSDILSYGSTLTGLNIGHETQPTDDTQVTNVIAYNNVLEGITITGSARVRVSNAVLYNNQQNNLRVATGSTGIQLVGITSRDSAGGQGILLGFGSDHLVAGCRVYGNRAAGIYVSPSVKARLIGNAVSNNDQGGFGSAGITLDTSVDCLVSDNESFDDQGVPTQEYGIWVAGGSDHRIANNRMYGNVTQDLRITSAPTGVVYTDNDPSTSDTNAVVTTHAAAADPHTGYQKETERGAANGYAPLDASSLVPLANLPARLRFVPITRATVFSGATTAATIARTLTAAITELPADAVLASGYLEIQSDTHNASNFIIVYHTESGTNDLAILAREQVVNMPLTLPFQAQIVHSTGRKLSYSVNRGAGTLTYSLFVTGYWTAA